MKVAKKVSKNSVIDTAVDARIAEIAEIACSETISAFVATLASKTKIHGVHLALAVPGACHDHPPTTDIVEGCAYCERNGNVFSAEDTPGNVFSAEDTTSRDPAPRATKTEATTKAKDAVVTYVHEIRDTLRRLAEHVDRIVTTHRRGTNDVEDTSTMSTGVDDGLDVDDLDDLETQLLEALLS